MKRKLLLLTVLLGTQGFLLGMGGPGATRGSIAPGPVIQTQVSTLLEQSLQALEKNLEQKILRAEYTDLVKEVEKLPGDLIYPLILRMALRNKNLSVADKLNLLGAAFYSKEPHVKNFKRVFNKLRTVLASGIFPMNYKGDLTSKYFNKINEVGGKVVSSDQTLLHYAITRGDVPLIKLLLDAGVDVNFQSGDGRVFLLDKWNKIGRFSKMPPLVWASYLGKINIADLLLKYGADVNLSSLDAAKTPLIIAILQKDKKLFDLLVKAGAVVDDMALSWAFHSNNNMLEKVLNSASASVLKLNNILDEEIGTYLDWAIYRGDQEKINLLRKYGAKKASELEQGK